jgi:hypothetical protein
MKWLSSKPKIKVFITKTKKFRASIKEPGKPAYEVTVGGKKWHEGCGRQYEEVIFIKCETLFDKIQEELNRIIYD